MGPDPAVATVRRAVRRALADLPVRDRDRPLLVALSGGPDSIALAAATAFTADRNGLRAGAVVVDHGLQEASAAVAARAATLAFELGLDPVQIVRVDVAAGPGAGGPEASARAARYVALEAAAVETATPGSEDGPATAGPGALVLLGHTRDDQAETVLLGLGRGSGPRSIAGMRRRDGRYLRPFLDVDRATTEQACAALGLPVWTDPHNADPSFRRVRLRREVLPLLEEVLGGGVRAALARTADLLRADLDALELLARERSASRAAGAAADARLDAGRDPGPGGGPDADFQADPGPAFPAGADAGAVLVVADLLGEPEALRARVLRRWATTNGAGPLTAAHITALVELVLPPTGREGRQAHLPGGYVAVRRSGRLHMHRIDVRPGA